MASATAIFINEREAIAVRVDGSAKKPKLTRAGRIEFEPVLPGDDGLPPSEEAVFDSQMIQLKAWLKQSKFGGGNVILCADPASVILRDLKVAFTERRQIDKVIAFQVEGVIPSIDIEDLAVTYTMLEKEADGSRLLVAAAHREPLRDALELLDDSGIVPVMADSTVGGALNLRALSPELSNTPKPTLWVDLQGDWALIAVLEGTTILGMRMIRVPAAATAEMQAAADAAAVGSADADDAPLVVMDDGDESEDGSEEAEWPDSNAGWPAEKSQSDAPQAPLSAEAQAAVEEASDRGQALLRMLVTEARRSILSAQAAGAISRVIVSGVPAGLAPISKLIQAELGIDAVTVIDLIDSMVPKSRKGQPKVDLPPSLMVPVLAGVALKGLGGDASGMDFLTGDLSPADAFEQSKSALAIGVTVLFLICGVVLMLVIREGQRIDQEAERRLNEVNIPSLHRLAYSGAPENRRASTSLPEYSDLMAQSIAVRDQMQQEINSIKAGNKRNFPPLFESDRAFQEFLKAVLLKLGEPMKGGGKNTEHFFLQKFELTQIPASAAGRSSSGQLIIEAYIEMQPNPKRFDLTDALYEIKVPNPSWDGRDPESQFVPLFETNGIKAESFGRDAVVDRGERKVGNKTEKIQIQLFRFTCTLTPLAYRGAENANRGPGAGGVRSRT